VEQVAVERLAGDSRYASFEHEVIMAEGTTISVSALSVVIPSKAAVLESPLQAIRK